jgi:hypothetical protein
MPLATRGARAMLKKELFNKCKVCVLSFESTRTRGRIREQRRSRERRGAKSSQSYLGIGHDCACLPPPLTFARDRTEGSVSLLPLRAYAGSDAKQDPTSGSRRSLEVENREKKLRQCCSYQIVIHTRNERMAPGGGRGGGGGARDEVVQMGGQTLKRVMDDATKQWVYRPVDEASGEVISKEAFEARQREERRTK